MGENILLPSIAQYCHFWEYCPAWENPGFPTWVFPGGQYFANLGENGCRNYFKTKSLQKIWPDRGSNPRPPEYQSDGTSDLAGPAVPNVNSSGLIKYTNYNKHNYDCDL